MANKRGFIAALMMSFSLMRAETITKEGADFRMPCSKSGNLVWDKEISGNFENIAVSGSVKGDPDKYELQTENGTQHLMVKNVSLADGGLYRCYVIFTSDYQEFEVDVHGIVH
jgi:hypothetical protein